MVTLKDIRAARKNLIGVAIHTPLLLLKFPVTNYPVWVKTENLQRGGAFKIRGAYNKIQSLSPKERRNGVVTHSSGNHAQGVALAAKLLGVRATVVTLNQALPAKVEATRGYGAEVIFGGDSSLAIKDRAEALSRERGCPLIPPYDDPWIIAGQGTVGLEILQDLKSISAIVVPIGGGGLISGIATAIKSLAPRVKVFGVEPEGAPKMYQSIQAGRIVTLPSTNTIADGLKPLRAGDLTFAIASRRVNDVVLVSDDEMRSAQRHLIFKEKLVVEPSGAASLAALMFGKIKGLRGNVVAVLSGGNADLQALQK